MKTTIAFTLIITFLSSLLISDFSNLPNYQVEPGVIGGISIMLFWLLMVIDFYKNKEIKKKFLIGVCLVIFNWIASFFYFAFHFIPRNETPKFWGNLIKESPQRIKVIKLVSIAFSLTILQRLFMSKILLAVGMPFPELYNLIINKFLYFPVQSLLKIFYTIIKIDINNPSYSVYAFSNFIDIFYTFILFYIAAAFFYRFKQNKEYALK